MKFLPELYRPEKTSTRNFCVVALALYAALIFFGVAHHEPWQDETEAWLTAGNMPMHDFRRHFAYSGHPPLWYLLLFPFARAGFPAETMQMINGLLSLSAAWLILFRSPLSLPVCAAFLFSHYMAYQYSVTARGYMLMIVVLFAVATHHPRRAEHPFFHSALISLLFFTEVFAFLPAFALAALFLLEQKTNRRRLSLSAAIIGGMGLTAFCAMWPGEEMRLKAGGFIFEPYNLQKAVEWAFMPMKLYKELAVYLQAPLPVFSFLSILHNICLLPGLLILALTALLVRSSRVRWVALACAGWLGFIFLFKYTPRYWHCGLLAVFTVWVLWLHRRENPQGKERAQKPLAALLCACFSLSALFAAAEHYREYRTAYNGGKDMGEYIRAKHPHALIASLHCSRASSVVAFAGDTAFWFVNQKREAHYVTHDLSDKTCNLGADHARTVSRTLEKIRARAKRERRKVLVLAMHPLDKNHPEMRGLHYSKGRTNSYWLYALPDASRDSTASQNSDSGEIP